jgi:hypothetical protein
MSQANNQTASSYVQYNMLQSAGFKAFKRGARLNEDNPFSYDKERDAWLNWREDWLAAERMLEDNHYQPSPVNNVFENRLRAMELFAVRVFLPAAVTVMTVLFFLSEKAPPLH